MTIRINAYRNESCDSESVFNSDDSIEISNENK